MREPSRTVRTRSFVVALSASFKMPNPTITKADALKILKLDGTGTAPSADAIKQNYQQLALQFHPSKQRANSLYVKVFDRLCRSYLILTEGRESMEETLTPPQMINVFVSAFELGALPFARHVPAQDASTQCGAAAREGTRTTAASPGASAAAAKITAPARKAASTQVPSPTRCACCSRAAHGPSMPSKLAVPSKAVASATVATGASAAAPVKKPVAAVKGTEKKGAAEATPDAKQPDKDAKKAARKASKRRRQKQRRVERKTVSKAPEKEESSSSSTEEWRDVEDDEELDPNCAFVATALSKMSTGAGARSKVASAGTIPKTVSQKDLRARSKTLACEGYEMCTLGRYKDAIDLFTNAIKLCGTEHSYYGNRSYCYLILEKFDKALKDADMSIQLGPHSAKGFFRRGKALLGLQRYSEAAEAFQAVLNLEPNCPDAVKELHVVHSYELKNMGFTQEQVDWAMLHGAIDVQTAVNLLCGPNAVARDIKENPGNLEGSRSLWVGNLTAGVTEKMLRSMFSRYGEVHSIRILHDRHCAFINYNNTVSPGKAMDALQGTSLCGSTILIRFPDNNFLEKKKNDYAPRSNVGASASGGEQHQTRPASAEASTSPAGAESAPKPKMRGPVNGNECFFWRTSGCIFGDKCHNQHIASHRGIDHKPPRFEKFN